MFRMQRLSAIALLPFVLAHLVTVLWLGAGGLTAQQILTRTGGSLLWAGFYGGFVVLISIHGAIGLWQVGNQAGKLSKRLLATAAILFAALVLGFGLQAVLGLYAGSAPA